MVLVHAYWAPFYSNVFVLRWPIKCLKRTNQIVRSEQIVKFDI
jgi:hypothetical protein